MSMITSVGEFIAMQPRLTWRRKAMRALIRSLGFGALWKMDITGVENIPASGPAIIMMNHISLIDPILCLGAVTHRFVIPMSKIENMRNPVFRPLIDWWGVYYVNRNEVDRKALVHSIELVKSGQLILIAPEGTRQSNGLVEPKDGLAYVATKADAVIIPTGISGAMDWGRNLKRLRRTQISLNFGRAFRFRSSGAGRVSREQLSAMSHEAMYQLALAVRDESQRGVYSDLSKATTQYLEFVV